MGHKLFGIDIAKEIARAAGPGLLPVSLLKAQVGQRDSADPTAGKTTTYKTYPCRGVEDNSEETRRAGTAAQQSGRLILILAGTLPSGVIPVPGDRIRILSETLEIIGEGVSSDPARATYLCACQG